MIDQEDGTVRRSCVCPRCGASFNFILPQSSLVTRRLDLWIKHHVETCGVKRARFHVWGDGREETR